MEKYIKVIIWLIFIIQLNSVSFSGRGNWTVMKYDAQELI